MGTRTATSSCRKWGAGWPSLRASDMLGRLGGDEFVLIGPGPALARGDAGPIGHESCAARPKRPRALEDRTAAAALGNFQLGEITLPYDGASVGVVALDPRGLSAESGQAGRYAHVRGQAGAQGRARDALSARRQRASS